MKKTYVYKIHWVENGKRKSAQFSTNNDMLNCAVLDFCLERGVDCSHITSARKVATI